MSHALASRARLWIIVAILSSSSLTFFLYVLVKQLAGPHAALDFYGSQGKMGTYTKKPPTLVCFS